VQHHNHQHLLRRGQTTQIGQNSLSRFRVIRVRLGDCPDYIADPVRHGRKFNYRLAIYRVVLNVLSRFDFNHIVRAVDILEYHNGLADHGLDTNGGFFS
jgi:hypothetical protein